MNIHKSITAELISETIEAGYSSLDNIGFCVECGAEHDGIEPDAEKDECENCGAMGVYGAEQLAIMMF